MNLLRSGGLPALVSPERCDDHQDSQQNRNKCERSEEKEEQHVHDQQEAEEDYPLATFHHLAFARTSDIDLGSSTCDSSLGRNVEGLKSALLTCCLRSIARCYSLISYYERGHARCTDDFSEYRSTVLNLTHMNHRQRKRPCERSVWNGPVSFILANVFTKILLRRG